MSNAELLIEEMKALPDDYAAEALDFIGYLREKAAKRQGGCPLCAKHRDPKTGEPLFNAETIAAFEEGDAMMRGEKPAKWHRSLEDLDKILGL
jgi:hypothetical protein